MSGRHRQTQPGLTRRALAGAVPVLGAATGLVLGTGVAAPQVAGAVEDTVVPPVVEPPDAPPAVDEPGLPRTNVPGRSDQAVSAVSAAADAARRQDALARAGEQRTVTAVAEGVRAEARERDEAARRKGLAELEAFRDDQARQERLQEQEAEVPGPDTPSEPGECDPSGMPRLGPSAGSDEIVDRDCGLTDAGDRDGSPDPWFDGPLLSDD